MSEYSTRLGCQLTFNEQMEGDIIELIKELNSSHKTGKFISNLIRIAMDNPEMLGENARKHIIENIQTCGVSYSRVKAFNEISNEVSKMKKKIDTMYEMNIQMYILAKAGKKLGLENKTQTNLRTQFLLERQLKEIQDKLDIILVDDGFSSDKLQNIEEIAEKALEFIIESYDGIIREIVSEQKAMNAVGAYNNYSENKIAEVSRESLNSHETADIEGSKVENEVNSESETETETDEVIEFAQNEDLSALLNFFNE